MQLTLYLGGCGGEIVADEDNDVRTTVKPEVHVTSTLGTEEPLV
jgi:hypothetical protein